MDVDLLKEQLEEEQDCRAEVQRALNKALTDVATWRQKCESGEGGVRSEEMDELKRKMNARITELELIAEAATTKAGSLEKACNRLKGDLEDVNIEVEQVILRSSSLLISTLIFLLKSSLTIKRMNE